MEKEQYLEAGKIVNTHGLKGDVKAESWCDSQKVLTGLSTLYFKLSDGYVAKKVEHATIHQKHVLLKFEGIDDIDAANRLRNRVLYADRKDIPLKKGEAFLVDILGLPVLDIDTGKCYGTVRDVIEEPQGPLYEIAEPCGKTAYLPSIAPFIVKIDTEEGVFVRPIEGLFHEI